MPEHKSEDYKQSAIDYYLVSDVSQVETCKIFKCSPRSLMRWLEKYENAGSLERDNRKPVAYKVTKEHVKFLLNEIKKNRMTTMKELKDKLKQQFDVKLSRYHINRIIDDNNISLKQTRVRHVPDKRFGKDINIDDKLKEFYDEVNKYRIEDIICIDETSVSAFQKRNHCYNDIGKRCVIKTQSQEVFKKYTGIFAISTNGMIGGTLYEKSGIDSDRLYEFLQNNITSRHRNKLIILDNASSHRNERIKELVNEHNQLLYSVPYQHFTNAIEMYFSLLKSKLRKQQTGFKYVDLINDINRAIGEIPLEVYKNILNGAYNRTTKYVKKQSNRVKPLKNYK